MARSLYKGPFVDKKLYENIQKVRSGQKRGMIKTNSRASTILPLMVNLTIGVHNGRAYVPLLITENMVGFKLGEFVLTRLFKMHAGDRKSK